MTDLCTSYHPMLRPSQKLIAKKLGISTAAVSLALSGKGSVSKELCSKIQTTAQELGYRPNPMLSSLAASRFRRPNSASRASIALLDFLPTQGKALYQRYLAAEAESQGYSVTTFTLAELQRLRDPSRVLYHRGVQGLIVLAPLNEPLLFERLDWNLFSVVFCGRFYQSPPFVTVRPDVGQAVRESYRRVKEKGYRRIGFALARHHPRVEDDEERLATALALQAAEREAGIETVPLFLEPLEDLEAFMNWFVRYKPDAVIGFRYEYLQLLFQHGFRVPEDVGYACLHLSGGRRPVAKREERVYSGMEQNRELIARRSIHALDQNIRHGIKGAPDAPEQVLIPSKWIEGDTLRLLAT